MTAVLDWDLASVGPREMDLGWHFGLEHMMASLFGGRLPGFPEHGRGAGALRAAAAATTCTTSRGTRSSHWSRALAINDRHQRITGDPRRTENPMGAILLARLEAAERAGVAPRRGATRSAPWPGTSRGAVADHGPAQDRSGAGSRSEKPMTPALETS